MSEQTEARALSGAQIARATGLIVMGFILSRVLGLVRQSLIAATFNEFARDAYFAALRPPETIFLVVAGGALGSAFIPTFTDYLAEGRRRDAWRLTNSVLNLILIILMIVSAVAAIFAPSVVDVLSPGFDLDKQALTTQLMRIMLVTPIIFGAAGLFMGLLNAHQRFLLPAFAPAIYNLGIIAGIVFLSPRMGIQGAAVGTVIGAVAYLILLLPGVMGVRFPYHPVIAIKDSGVVEVARLMGPRVLGLAVIQANFWVNTALASDMVEGSVDAITNAFYILLLPQGVIAQSVANAVFPTFAAQVSTGDSDGLNRTLGQVLRSVMFLAIPATVGLVMLRLPIVRLIFERNAFTFENSQAVAWALLFYGLGLASHALVEILSRAYYAMHDTWTPVLIGGGAMATNIILSLILIRFIGQPGNLAMGPFAGLALANTIATTVEGLLLLVILGPRVGGYRASNLMGSLLRTAGASLVMGGVLWVGLTLTQGLSVWLSVPVLVTVGGLTFGGAAWLLGSPETRLFIGLIANHLARE